MSSFRQHFDRAATKVADIIDRNVSPQAAEKAGLVATYGSIALPLLCAASAPSMIAAIVISAIPIGLATYTNLRGAYTGSCGTGQKLTDSLGFRKEMEVTTVALIGAAVFGVCGAGVFATHEADKARHAYIESLPELPVDPKDSIALSSKELEKLASDKDITLVPVLPADSGDTVRVDKETLERLAKQGDVQILTVQPSDKKGKFQLNKTDFETVVCKWISGPVIVPHNGQNYKYICPARQ